MITILSIYIIISIIYYLLLDKGINEAIKKDPDFNIEYLKIEPKTNEIIKIFLAIFWPLSFLMLIFNTKIEKRLK